MSTLLPADYFSSTAFASAAAAHGVPLLSAAVGVRVNDAMQCLRSGAFMRTVHLVFCQSVHGWDEGQLLEFDSTGATQGDADAAVYRELWELLSNSSGFSMDACAPTCNICAIVRQYYECARLSAEWCRP
jgi:hypothetical protein